MSGRGKSRWKALVVAAAMFGIPCVAVADDKPANAPHGTVTLPDGSVIAVEFHASGDLGVLIGRLPDGSAAPVKAVESVADALKVLADRRLASVWPALLEWAGPDLALLRDRALARSKLGAEAGFPTATPTGQAEQWSGDPALIGVLHYARSLVEAGHIAEALALLEARDAAAPTDAQHAYYHIFLRIREANIRFDSGDAAGAAALLEHAVQDPGLDGEYKLNLLVNEAMFLARSDQSQAALVIINNAWKDFDAAAQETDDWVKVPSSEANFAWIKACALDGLGQHDKARALMAQIGTATPDAPDASVFATARVGGFLCMRDDAALADEFAAQIKSASPAADIFVTVQPEADRNLRDRAVTTAAMRRPQMAKLLVERVRLLAPGFAPALGKWDGATTGTP